MLKPKTLLRCLCLLLFLSIFDEAKSGHAQGLRAVYDGRAETTASKPSNAEVQLIRRHALPKARQFWRKNGACAEGFEVIDVASGSFTKPNAAQKAVLYRFCVTGHDFANNGIAIIEDGSIVAHVLYAGGEDYSIGALADINDNGLSEIILGDGSIHQGYAVAVATLIEVSPSGVRKFGIADAYEDDCGAKEKCRTIAYKISARPGQPPTFYRESYRKRKERWIKAGNSVRYSLRTNEIIYRLVN